MMKLKRKRSKVNQKSFKPVGNDLLNYLIRYRNRVIRYWNTRNETSGSLHEGFLPLLHCYLLIFIHEMNVNILNKC